MMSNFNPVIYHTVDGPVRGPVVDAPADIIVEQIGRGNIDAWRGLLQNIGSSEEEFINEVAEAVKKDFDELIAKKNSSKAVE
jgi:hypothetical protein